MEDSLCPQFHHQRHSPLPPRPPTRTPLLDPMWAARAWSTLRAQTCQHPAQGQTHIRSTAATHQVHMATRGAAPPPPGGTHLPSTASTSRHSISCSCSARSIRSRRSCRRFRLIMKTCGPELWLDPPGRPPAPPLREGPAYLVKAHLVWRLGRHREEPRGLRGWVLHWAAERSRGVTGVIGKSGGVQPPSNAPSPPSAGLPVIPSSSAWCWKPCPTQPRSQHQC